MEVLAAFFLFCGVVFGAIEVVEHVKCEQSEKKTDDCKNP